MRSNVLIMKILFVGPLPFIHRPINVSLVEMIRPQPRKKPFKIVLEQVLFFLKLKLDMGCPKNVGLVFSLSTGCCEHKYNMVELILKVHLLSLNSKHIASYGVNKKKPPSFESYTTTISNLILIFL